MRKYINIFFSITLTFFLVLTTACGKEKNKETGFKIDTNDMKLTYYLGEDLLLDGLEIYSAYEIGEYKLLDDTKYTIDYRSYNKDVAGLYEIKVDYKDYKTKSFYVEVIKFSKNALTEMPKETLTVSSITMPIVDGVEYKFDNGNYGDDNQWNFLEAGSTHTIYARYKETATTYASPAISKTYTLPSGPASATLTSQYKSVNKEEPLEFKISITPNDNLNDLVYLKLNVESSDDVDYTIEYFEDNNWISIEDGIYKKEGFNLIAMDVKFRITANTKCTLKVYSTLHTVEEDLLLAQSNYMNFYIVLGPVKGKVLTDGPAIVNEAYEFEIDIDINGDTYLTDSWKVRANVTFNQDFVPNDGWTLEYFDEDSQTWKLIEDYSFHRSGIYLQDKTYKFRFTAIEAETHTFGIHYQLMGKDNIVLSNVVRIEVVELSEVKGNALVELSNMTNISLYSPENQEIINEAKTLAAEKITNATNSQTIKEALNEYKELLDSTPKL